jgi:hypothetical protein
MPATWIRNKKTGEWRSVDAQFGAVVRLEQDEEIGYEPAPPITHNETVEQALHRIEAMAPSAQFHQTLAAGYQTKDSGAKETFPSGYQRDSRVGKGRYDLLAHAHYALAELAALFERGAIKYGEANWTKGAPLSRYCDSMLRHGFQAAAGFEDESHFASTAWNALCALETRLRVRMGLLPAELDDLPKYERKENA